MQISYFQVLFTFSKKVDPEWLRMIMKTRTLLLSILMISKPQWNLAKVRNECQSSVYNSQSDFENFTYCKSF